MSSFAPRCLSLDLEVGLHDALIHSFAAVRGDQPDVSLHFKQGKLLAALDRLDVLAEGANFLLGHNLINFDLPHLAAAKPNLSLLRLPAVDTGPFQLSLKMLNFSYSCPSCNKIPSSCYDLLAAHAWRI